MHSGNSQSERICSSSLSDLHRLVVEGVARVGARRRPDQRLMGIGEAAAAEIRHRIGLAPDDVVENPEAEILQDGADAEDVVIGADDPQRAIGLERAAAFGEPGARERVVVGEARELVPVVVDAHRRGSGRAGAARRRAADYRADRRRRGRRMRKGSSSALRDSRRSGWYCEAA